MIESGAVCLAYETVETDNHQLPLLIPMSEVAGRMATLNGAYYLQKTKGGKGKLISGVPGVDRTKVLILGGGTVGEAGMRTGCRRMDNGYLAAKTAPTRNGTADKRTYTILH